MPCVQIVLPTPECASVKFQFCFISSPPDYNWYTWHSAEEGGQMLKLSSLDFAMQAKYSTSKNFIFRLKLPLPSHCPGQITRQWRSCSLKSCVAPFLQPPSFFHVFLPPMFHRKHFTRAEQLIIPITITLRRTELFSFLLVTSPQLVQCNLDVAKGFCKLTFSSKPHHHKLWQIRMYYWIITEWILKTSYKNFYPTNIQSANWIREKSLDVMASIQY